MRACMILVPCLMAYSLCVASLVIGADLPANLAGIMDIHGILPRKGLPPFAVSAIIIFLWIAFTVARSFKKNSAVILPGKILSAPLNSLQELRISFERGEIPVSSLCEQLAQLLKTEILSDDNPALRHSAKDKHYLFFAECLTNYEVIDAARGNMSVTMLNQVAGLFEFCDRVRFGGDKPGTASVLMALDEACLIINRSTENGP